MQSPCGVATAARLSHYKDGRRNDLMGKCCMETKQGRNVAMTNALSASRTDKCGVMHGMAARHCNRGLFLSNRPGVERCQKCVHGSTMIVKQPAVRLPPTVTQG